MSASPQTTLRAAVAERLAGVSPAIAEVIAEHYAKKAIDKAADLLIKGLDQYDQLQRQMNKIAKPDITTYNADKTVATELYSKGRLDEIEKVQKQIDKLGGAIDKALDKGDLQDLANLTANTPKQED